MEKKINYFLKSYSEVAKDMKVQWKQNPLKCLRSAVYTRLITRKTKVALGTVKEIEAVGEGLKNEGILRIYWLAANQPKTFKLNFPFLVAAGSWKDVFKLLSLDLQYNGWNKRKLDWNFLGTAISLGLTNPETTDLVRKYMPTIRTNKNCTTEESKNYTLVGRWLARKLFPNLSKESAYKAYRKVKSQGKAHEWQQFISKQLYDKINFDNIASKALSLLVNSNFLKNHNLINKYNDWFVPKKDYNTCKNSSDFLRFLSVSKNR